MSQVLPAAGNETRFARPVNLGKASETMLLRHLMTVHSMPLKVRYLPEVAGYEREPEMDRTGRARNRNSEPDEPAYLNARPY